MATRQAYDATASTVLTATNLDKHAGGWIGYVESTSAQTTITTAVDLTSLTLTVTANANRYHRTTLKVELSSSAADDVAGIYIADGSNTNINRATSGPLAAAGATTTLTATAIETGWSGSTTRKGRIQRETGSGNITTASASGRPSYLLIEDLGSSS